MSPTSSALLVAGSAALLAAAAYSMQPKRKQSSSDNASREIEEYGEADCITAEDVCKIFDRLFLEMQSVVPQLYNQVQNMQIPRGMQMGGGQIIPEQQLRQLALKMEFEHVLKSRQAMVFEEFDVDEECIEEATFEFLDQEEEYPKVKTAVERFQKLYERVSGVSVVQKRKDAKEAPVEILSKDNFLKAAEIFFASFTSSMELLVKELKAEGNNLNGRAFTQELQMKYASMANDAAKEILEEKGITFESFEASAQKHANNPEVARSLSMMQMRQQIALQSVMSG